jgi:hypothetical protein
MFAVALEQIGEDANQITRFLGVSGDKHLIFQELEKMRRKRPTFRKFVSLALMLRRRNGKESVFFDVLRG